MSQPEPGACGDPGCYVLHADPSNPIHPSHCSTCVCGRRAPGASQPHAQQDRVTDSAAVCSFCQTTARYEVGTETTFQNACRRHLARAVDWLWRESSDQWFKITLLTDEVRDGE